MCLGPSQHGGLFPVQVVQETRCAMASLLNPRHEKCQSITFALICGSRQSESPPNSKEGTGWILKKCCDLLFLCDYFKPPSSTLLPKLFPYLHISHMQNLCRPPPLLPNTPPPTYSLIYTLMASSSSSKFRLLSFKSGPGVNEVPWVWALSIWRPVNQRGKLYPHTH